MITTLVASTLLALAPASDLYDAPILLDIGRPPPCTQDTECASPDTPLCNVETGECVECLGAEHCPEGWACGPTNSCRDACEEQTDCEDVEDLCHPDTGFCVQCIDATNCAPEEYCEEEGGFCRLDLCEAGQTTACSSWMIVECTADGGPGEVLDICAEGCEVVDGMAQCVMTGGSSGGSSGGTAGGSAGMGSDEAEGGGGAGTTMGASAGTEASGASGPTTVDATDGDEGCACRADAPAGSAGAWSWWLVVGLGLARRRRR